jgi:L-asparaginase II
MKQIELDVAVTRGGRVESIHQVHAAVLDSRGRLIAAARDHRMVTFWRSCAKPFQVMPLVEADALEALGWDDPELAIACGSHGGEPEHVALVTNMLADCGLEEGDLVCGPHDPLAARGLRALRESGESPTRLHNNCSGKHAAMLARAVTAGWPAAGYEKPEHGVQRSVAEMVSRWTNVPSASLLTAVDGCGVPVFGLTLEAMALSYARFGAAALRGEEVPARVLSAMSRNPFLVGGTDRFDTVLMEQTGGRVIAKVGAEGVHSVSIPEMGLGAAVKVADGAVRAQHVAVLQLLKVLGVFGGELPGELDGLLRRTVTNTRGETVGEILPAGTGIAGGAILG